jgi:hypothetical protein
MIVARSAARLGLVGALLAGVVVAGPAAPAAAQDPAGPWAPGQPCPDAIVVGAAGSGQQEMPSELGMGTQVDGIVRAIARAGTGLEIAALPLPYPAARVFPTSGYLASVEAGLEALPTTVASIADACPGTGIVLVGYSQGAQVIQVGLDRIRSTEWGGADHSSHIDAVVLLASPLFTPQAGTTRFGNFDPARRGLLGGSDVPAWITEDTISWCRGADLVCQGGDLGSLLAYGSATSRSVHATYQDAVTQRIVGSLAVARLDVDPAAPPAAEPGPPAPGTAAAEEADRPLGPAASAGRFTNEILAREVSYALPVDARGSTHREAIARVLAGGVMSGYADGSFGPAAQLTRGQAATVLVNAFALPRDGRSGAFSDTAGSVHDRAIGAAADAGLINGFPDGSFRPAETVTRAQFVSMLANGLGLRPAYDPSWDAFDDVSAANVHRPGVMAMTRLGLISGVADGSTAGGSGPQPPTTRTFAPGQAVTRGQAASLVARSVIQRVASDPDRYLVGVWERWNEEAYCTSTLVAPNPYAPNALSAQRVGDDGGVVTEGSGGPSGGLMVACQDARQRDVEPYVLELWVAPDAETADPDSWAGAPDNGTRITWLRRDPR